MTNVLGAVLFAIFGCLVLMATLVSARSNEADARRWVNRLIAVTLVFGLGAAILHREVWPFSRWNIFSERLTQPVYEVRVVGTDATGREHDIDRRAFEPFTSIDLYTWLDFHFAKLSADEQRTAAAYLVGLMNRARLNALAGHTIGSHQRYLGAAAAPVHILHAPIWNDAAAVPREPFTGLRVYVDRWDVLERRRDPTKVRHELRYEYREAAK